MNYMAEFCKTLASDFRAQGATGRTRRRSMRVVKLVALMADRNVTGKELAARAGISRSTLSSVINRRCTPSPETAASIARVLGVAVNELGVMVLPRRKRRSGLEVRAAEDHDTTNTGPSDADQIEAMLSIHNGVLHIADKHGVVEVLPSGAALAHGPPMKDTIPGASVEHARTVIQAVMDITCRFMGRPDHGLPQAE